VHGIDTHSETVEKMIKILPASAAVVAARNPGTECNLLFDISKSTLSVELRYRCFLLPPLQAGSKTIITARMGNNTEYNVFVFIDRKEWRRRQKVN